jgi:heme ABC exporter ATP-binding subunit CcmA
MEPVVHLRDAVALLGRFPALAGIDLDVARGEIVLLRGPNGAGKTTVLRVCAGLVPVVRGQAVVLGHDLCHDARAVRRRVGMLGHATGLFDDLTVAGNVTFWGRAHRAGRGDVEAALGLVGLAGRLRDVPVARLSAGQRRRSSLACLLVRRPELWLLDEPHAGLDHDARDLLDRLVRQAVAQGATVVMSSHELDRAEALADRVVTVDGGVTRGGEPALRRTAPGIEPEMAADATAASAPEVTHVA